MAVTKILKQYLDKNKIKYKTKWHEEVYTAQEVAHAEHVPGRFLAKTVIVNVDGKLGMAVLPAHLLIDIAKIKKITGAKKVRLAAEEEFKDLFPGCDVGAMPPFGNLYNLKVVVDKALTEDEFIIFNAGTHRDTIQMSYRDFERLVKPMKADFGRLPLVAAGK